MPGILFGCDPCVRTKSSVADRSPGVLVYAEKSRIRWIIWHCDMSKSIDLIYRLVTIHVTSSCGRSTRSPLTPA